MSTYSVADAKAGLPRLINRATAGEEVIITVTESRWRN